MSEHVVEQVTGENAAPPVPPEPPPAGETIPVRPGVAEAATFAALMAKPKRTDEISLPNPAGGTLVVKAEAIGHLEYDQLVAECKPTEQQRLEGNFYDVSKFAPRLLAACLTQPRLTVSEAEQLWTHPDWSSGELFGLFRRVNDLCQRGLDVPFTAPG